MPLAGSLRVDQSPPAACTAVEQAAAAVIGTQAGNSSALYFGKSVKMPVRLAAVGRARVPLKDYRYLNFSLQSGSSEGTYRRVRSCAVWLYHDTGNGKAMPTLCRHLPRERRTASRRADVTHPALRPSTLHRRRLRGNPRRARCVLDPRFRRAQRWGASRRSRALSTYDEKEGSPDERRIPPM